MIDLHIHTGLSHHGFGSVQDAVSRAIDVGIRIVGLIEHAPLPFDREHRLTKRETQLYLQDVRKLQRRRGNSIVILAGLEVDYLPEYEEYSRSTLADLDYDFALGAIHFIDMEEGRIPIWNYEKLGSSQGIEAYFLALFKATQSDMFQAIAHPDAILRSGIATAVFRARMNQIVRDIPGYEVNCSGYTKRRYDRESQSMVAGPSYPDIEYAAQVAKTGTPIILGSDAHSPNLIGANVDQAMAQLKEMGIGHVHYYEGGWHQFAI